MTRTTWIRGTHFWRVVAGATLLLLASRAGVPADAAEGAPQAVFHHAHLTATDPKSAIQWYLKNLGGRVTKEGPFDALLSNNVNILFFRGKQGIPGSVGSSVDHIGFSYKDIEAKMKELEEAGVEIVSGIEQEGPIKYALVRDPWGTLV